MELITANDCQAIVDKWFETSEAKLLSFEQVRDPDMSLGFLGAKQTLCLTVEHKGQIKLLRFFIKTPPGPNGFLRDFVKSNDCCHKEHSFYSEIGPMLRPYMEGKVFPRCLVSREDEVMILEDLGESGYETRPLRNYMCLEDLEKTVEAVAGLHAASLAWEELNGAFFGDKYPRLMTESYYKRGNPGLLHLFTSIRALEAVYEQHLTTHLPRWMFDEALEVFRGLPDSLAPSTKYRNVVSHGDLWCNNIMLPRKTSANGACLVDFQLIRYTPPVLDVLMLIHLNGDAETRRTQAGHILRRYHGYLRTALAAHRLDLDLILPWDRFLESKKDYEAISLALAALFLHLVLLEERLVTQTFASPQNLEIFMNHTRSGLVLQAISSDPLYKRRVIGALSDLIHLTAANKKPLPKK